MAKNSNSFHEPPFRFLYRAMADCVARTAVFRRGDHVSVAVIVQEQPARDVSLNDSRHSCPWPITSVARVASFPRTEITAPLSCGSA